MKASPATAVSANSITIKPCACIQPFQDERYGSGMRVHNATKATQSQPPGARCTGCKLLRR